MVNFDPIIRKDYDSENYTLVYADGTKHRFGDKPRYESLDLKVTDFCDIGCSYCHEMSTRKGKHATLENVISIFSRKPYSDVVEIAIGGGNPFDWPHLNAFLDYCENKFLVNITVNQKHLQKYITENNRAVLDILPRFRGIGISVVNPDGLEILTDTHPHMVSHVIAGVHDFDFVEKVLERSIRLLILGYKTFGRGIRFRSPKVDTNINTLVWNLRSLLGRDNKIVAFDNLGIEQLKPERFIVDWDSIYMGDDGVYSCYIDAVKMKQYTSSFNRDAEISL